MNTWKKLRTRFKALFRSNSIESELDQELRFHLESEIDNNIKKGMNPAEARRAAKLEFGSLDRTKEECRDSWGVRFIQDTIRDLRHAFRTLGKHKGFSFTVIATLAIGIGAVTTVYSIAYGIMLRPLPYDHPERLTMAFETQMPSSRFLNVSPATYLGWKEEATDFEALAATHDRAYNMSGAGEPVRVYGQTSSADFFSILGVQPALGRGFLPGEDSADKANVVVLSHKLWKSRFEADPSILGRSILLDKAPFTIIGVMPDSFQFNPGYEVYTTIPFTAESRSDYGRTYQVMGRLKPDVSIEQAAAQMETISAHLAATFPSEYEGSGINLISLHAYFSQGAEVLYFLLGAVGFLLLIACTNIANLQLARSTSRYAEIAVRTVLGAPRWSIVRQLLTENLVFAVIGGVFGILMGRWGLRITGSFVPAGIPHMDQVSVDGTIVFTAFAIAVCTSLVFGLVPALQTSRIDINSILKNSGRRGTNGSKGTHRARNTLVVAQVAFALILLSGAGLFFRSLTKAQKSDVGYETETTYLGVLLLSDEKYPEPQQQVNVIGQLVERIAQVPGIESVTFTNHTLPNGGAPMAPYSIGGSPDVDPSQRSFSFYYGVTRDYFDTLRIPLLLGRTFNEMDVLDSTRVVLINEALAKAEFGDESPIGKLITIHNEWEIARVIVGVVGNAIQGGRMSPQRPQIYEPYEQIPQLSTSYLFRTDGAPPDTQAVLAAFHSVDPEIPILTMYHVAEGLQHGLKSYRWVVGLFSTFSVIALILASMGIYGVIAFNVAQRTGEIGIRMALGARRSNVVRLVLLHSGRLIIIGMGIGLAGSIALSHLLGSLIYNTSPYDPLTLVSITVILGTAATLACYLPTRRATMIDPMVALRSE